MPSPRPWGYMEMGLHGRSLGPHKKDIMSYLQIVTSIFISFALGLLALKPEWTSAVAVCFSLSLLGAVTALEKKTIADTIELKTQIKDLKNKVEMLMVQKGFGR